MVRRFLMAPLLALAFGPAHALSLAGTAWEHVGAAHGIEPLLLYAVALQETRKLDPELGGVRPSPWALRIGDEGIFARSREEARTRLAAARKQTRRIDIGLMQVNLHWHGHRVPDADALLDPLTNLEVAAQILREALDSAPNDPVLGVGRYHNWNPSIARPYGQRVLEIFDRLQKEARP